MTMRTGAATILGLLLSSRVWAHGNGQPIGPDDVWHHWSTDPWVVIPVALVSFLYARGVIRMWTHAGTGRGISVPRAAIFAAGAAVLAIALISPLDALGDTLLTAHMIQHTLLIGIVPPLLLAGQPGAALPWALPRRGRQALGRSTALRAVTRRLGFLLRPLPAATLHGVALWLWHAPALYEAALEHEAVHMAEHIAFFATAMLFWQSLWLASRSTATIPAGIAALFLTLLHGGFLSTLMTFSPRPFYSWYEGRPELWGLDALADQQLAGLIMGAPLMLVYLLACLALAAGLLKAAPAYEDRRPESAA